MNPFEMTVSIVAIVMIAKVLSARYRAMGAHDRPQPTDDADAARLHGELRQLKDRIQVLERIVTDGDRSRALDLERQIEALRHEREEAGQ